MSTEDVYEVWAAQCVNRSCVASLTFLVWDVLTTLDEERAFIWRKPLTWTRFLFLFIRYFAVAVQVALLFVGTELAASHPPTPTLTPTRSRGSCYGWFIFQALAMQVLVTSVDVVLMLRVQALYAHNALVKHGVVGLLLLEFGVMAACEYYTVAGLAFDDTCIVTRSSYAILGYGAAAIVYELILFVLTLVKFVHAVRAGWSDTPVLQLLVRDGTWAFGLIFVAMLANAICYGAVSGGLSAVAFTWLMSVLAFAGCRLMLNMHALGAPAAQTPYTTRERAADRAMHDTHLEFGPRSRSRSRNRALGSDSGGDRDAYSRAAYTDVESSEASSFAVDGFTVDGDGEGGGTFVLRDLDRAAKRGRGGQGVAFELGGSGVGLCELKNDGSAAKGKGRMPSTTTTKLDGRGAYRRSPLSSLSIDFASFASGTESAASGSSSSMTVDRGARGVGGNGALSSSSPVEGGEAQVLEAGAGRTTLRNVGTAEHEREHEHEPISPTTPLSADPLMHEWR